MERETIIELHGNEDLFKRIVVVEEMDNENFLLAYGRRGRVGLMGGTSLGHRGVRLGQALITPDRRPSPWSHAVIFGGNEGGDTSYLYESDFYIRWRELSLKNGVQVNPITKYKDEERWEFLAVLDFHLDGEEVNRVIEECRSMIKQGIGYAIGGLLSTGLAYLTGRLGRGRVRKTLFCSAFVQRAFLAVGIHFAPGIGLQNISPEHIWRTHIPHTSYIRQREWEKLKERAKYITEMKSLEDHPARA